MFKNAVRHFSYVEKEQRRGGEKPECLSWPSWWVKTGFAKKGALLWGHLRGPERLLSQWAEASSCNGITLHLWCTLSSTLAPGLHRDSGGSGLSSCWVLLMTGKANRRGMAPDQAFPSVSNGFNLEDLTASVNWHVWQGFGCCCFQSL